MSSNSKSVPLSVIQASCPDVFASRQRVAQVVPVEARNTGALPDFFAQLAQERREKAKALMLQAEQLQRAGEQFRAGISDEGTDELV